MMCVKTKLSESKIHGIGVFAAEFIKKGTLVWKFDPRIDKVLTKSDLENLALINKEFVLHYSYLTNNVFVLAGDNGMFVNHSLRPNLIGEDSADGYGICRALKDINVGEELTQDYSEFDENFNNRPI